MASIIDFNMNFVKNQVTDKDGNISFGGLVNTVRDAEDRLSKSLTQYLKRSMVASRVFIQQEVAQEEVLPDLLMTIQQMYIGWIMTAVQMNQYIDSSRTVRTALDIVATENMRHVSTQDLLQGFETFTYGSDYLPINRPTEPLGAGQHGGSGVIDTMPKNMNLPSGRIVEIKFNVGGDPRKQLAVNIYVQLMPTFIPSKVAAEFFHINFKPNWKQRWFQVTTGEKRFVSDFLFELDLLKKRNSAMKQDKTGMLREMMMRQKNGLTNYLLKLSGATPERQNIANTVHIYEKSSFDKWCKDSNCDFRRMDHRSKFFGRTFSVVVAVIDSAYGKVDMYFHGIDNRGEYNFNQLQQQAKSEKYDLQSIMKAYYTSSAPKF